MIDRHSLRIQPLQALVRRHRRGIVSAAVVALGGFGITAVAVSPLVAQEAEPAQRLVTETVAPLGLDAQLEALASQEFDLTRSDTVRAADTVQGLLARLGVRDAAAVQFMRQDAAVRQLFTGRSGKKVRVSTRRDGSLVELTAVLPSRDETLARTHFSRLTLHAADGRWQSRLEPVPYGTALRMASGTIRSSLFAATDDAGLPDAVAVQLAEIFANEIDMHRQLRRGDTFSVVYETLTADGEPVTWSDGIGRVTAAEFVNGGRAHHAMWFENIEGGDRRGAYYGLDGKSKRSAFLASPMEFSRVTSGFAMRFHPLLQRWRAHLGVDYGAPVGTAVRTVGDGVVEFAGVQNGYGNVVEIRHGQERTTLYAHLQQIDVKKGQRVEQGQTIGAVGMTGWTTGPHLHFEFRVKGEHQDPLLVARETQSTALDAAARQRFALMARSVQTKLDLAETLAGASRRAE